MDFLLRISNLVEVKALLLLMGVTLGACMDIVPPKKFTIINNSSLPKKLLKALLVV
jgi:hypothetical protein